MEFNHWIVPAIVGGIYWLIHKSKGELNERNNYKRRRLFSFVLLIMTVMNFFHIIFLFNRGIGTAPTKMLSLILAIVYLWYWLKAAWTPYEQFQSELHIPRSLSSAIKEKNFSIFLPFTWKKAKQIEITKPVEVSLNSKSDEVDYDKSIDKKKEDNKTLKSKLEELNTMKENGLISEEEFNKLREKYLNL